MTRNKTLPVLFLVCSKELGSLMSTTYEMEGSHLITSNAACRKHSIYYAACRKHLWIFSSLVLKIPVIKQAAQLPLEVIKCSRNHIIPKDCIWRVFIFPEGFLPSHKITLSEDQLAFMNCVQSWYFQDSSIWSLMATIMQP